MKPYHTNIEQESLNNDFRRVLFTTYNTQLVLMSLLPDEEIGEERHGVDQFIRIEAGEGKAVLNGKEFALSDGVAVIVPAGTKHNIINTGKKPMKLYTLYAPPNHIDGRVHKTKADAEADEDEDHFDGRTSAE